MQHHHKRMVVKMLRLGDVSPQEPIPVQVVEAVERAESLMWWANTSEFTDKELVPIVLGANGDRLARAALDRRRKADASEISDANVEKATNDSEFLRGKAAAKAV